jgi:hypothetical protein
MAQVTPNLALTVWNSLTDPYDSGQLADNFVKIDLHDHSGGGHGLPIDGSKSIVPNTITDVQLATNSVGTAEIQSGAVSADELADGQISRSKFSTAVGTTGGNGSPYYLSQGNPLPTGAVTGDEVYYQASNGTTPTTDTIYWHLRYNGTSWDFLGGSPLYKYNSANIVSNGTPTVDSWYGYWGTGATAGAFNSLAVPFAGTYVAEYSMTAADPANTSRGIFATAIAAGVAPSTNSTAVTSGVVSGSGAYSYYDSDMNALFSAGMTSRFSISAGTSSANRYVKILAKVLSSGYYVVNGSTIATLTIGSSGTPTTGNFSITENRISIRPVTVTNWS